jgi:hypothetical protein
MLTTLFKIVTSLILTFALITLINKRDFSVLFSHHVAQKENVAILDVVEKKSTLSYKEDPVQKPIEKHLTDPSLATESTVKKVSEPGSSAPVVKTISSSEVTPYITMTEGHSDTDETYKPTISPCTTTMGYKLGAFDARFGISKEDFLKEIEKGSKLWSDALGKKLFEYDEKGPLTINLIYDDRQARTVDLNYLILEIENTKRSAEILQENYEQEKIAYIERGDAFTRDSESFQEKYKTYTQKVESYNTQGGAPRAEYETMTQTLSDLKEEATSLDARRLVLISEMNTINTKVARYNEFIAYTNDLIRKSNSLGAKKFTEGRFSPAINTIDIYQYNTILKLRRVITHELGHALGINHNNSIESIMYAVNSATTTVLSKQDIRDLKATCSSY